ncbi:MAG: hypothetical protein M5U01_19600 [Ardenticatenaceae bacterium]|nr:hypothetical protein [Ardenticatenaceae bacterium]
MSEQKPIKTDKELVEAFDALFAEIPPPETPEEIDAILREASFDPDEVGARMQAAAERAWASSPLNWRNQNQKLTEAREHLESKSSTDRRSRAKILEDIEQTLAFLASVLTGNAQERLAAHHRNLEQATDDDLASLLDELQFLKDQWLKQNNLGEE